MLTARRRAMVALLRQIQPDVLHAQSVADPGWFAALSGFHPLVLTAWGSDVLLGLHRGSRLHRWLTRYALRRADLLTADARSVLNATRPHLRPDARVELIRFGVDTRAFCPGVDTTWRARLTLGTGPVLLSIRQCHPLYNIDVIIRAFARVREELPEARLVVKLVTQDADDPYLAEMRALAGQLALGDAIVYVPQVSYAEIPDLYRAADLVLSVPSSDALPVSVLEAMACGTPVITTDLPALRELMDDGAELALVPVRDVEALSRASLSLLADPVHRAQIGARNLEIVRRTGDFAVEMARMTHHYHELIEKA
jgi:glycosyltransferase involved in cell wall biosynthesis